MRHAPLYLIGITGNIACGKSTVVARLREHGAHTIDADQLTHALQEPGQPVYLAIVREFGSDMLTSPHGPIDRRRLGALVFADPSALQRLERIVHPAVHTAIRSWLDAQRAAASADTRAVAVIDAIKLLESGWKTECDAIWVVTSSREQQVQRLMLQRGLTEEEARVRIDAQPPQSAKIAQADVVIDNSGSLEETWWLVDVAWAAIPLVR